MRDLMMLAGLVAVGYVAVRLLAEIVDFVESLLPQQKSDPDHSGVALDGRVYLDASGPGEPKIIHGEDRIQLALARAWEGRGPVYAIDLRAMAASLHRDGHPHDAEHCDLCHQAKTVGGQTNG